MAKTLNRSNLPEATRKHIEQLLAKDINDMNYADKAYLRARKDYLTRSEQEDFSEVLKGKLKSPKVEVEEVPNSNTFVSPDEMGYNELIARAEQLQIKGVKPGMSQAKLLTLVKEEESKLAQSEE